MECRHFINGKNLKLKGSEVKGTEPFKGIEVDGRLLGYG